MAGNEVAQSGTSQRCTKKLGLKVESTKRGGGEDVQGRLVQKNTRPLERAAFYFAELWALSPCCGCHAGGPGSI